jgi:tartrate dehydratase alpha subunit/fumarate hydratase class I-like protein
MYPVAVVLQYNTQKTQNNTYTLKTIHNAIITNTITQNYKLKFKMVNIGTGCKKAKRIYLALEGN